MLTSGSEMRCLDALDPRLCVPRRLQDPAMSTQITAAWQAKLDQKCARDLIPKAWRLPSTIGLPRSLETSKTDLIALDIPRRSGILSPQELRITEEYDVKHLLRALASGDLTSLAVTTAFCKRAAIAQQLVCLYVCCGAKAPVRDLPVHVLIGIVPDILSHRDILRASSGQSTAAGLAAGKGPAGRPPPRAAHQPQRLIPGAGR